MRDRDIDAILKRTAGVPHNVDPALLHRISDSIGSSLYPVRPIPAPWVLASGLLLICMAVALGGAAFLGFHGIRRLSAAEIASIFPIIGIVTWIAAMSSAREIAPGSAPRVAAGWFPAAGSLVFIALFAAVFHDYHVDRFVHQGIVCLTAGLVHALVAGLAAFLLLRRGFAVDRVAAGMVTGTLAGLSGLTMLELHCANFQALHVLVWHTGVVLFSGLAGALLARIWPDRLSRTGHR